MEVDELDLNLGLLACPALCLSDLRAPVCVCACVYVYVYWEGLGGMPRIHWEILSCQVSGRGLERQLSPGHTFLKYLLFLC